MRLYKRIFNIQPYREQLPGRVDAMITKFDDGDLVFQIYVIDDRNYL